MQKHRILTTTNETFEFIGHQVTDIECEDMISYECEHNTILRLRQSSILAVIVYDDITDTVKIMR